MKFILLVFFIVIFSEDLFTRKASETDVICISPEEKKLYNLIMQYRKSRNLPPIPLSFKLTKVAQTHADDLVNNYSFDPKNSCNPHTWSTKGKWTGCCYTADHKQAECMWNKPKEVAGHSGVGYEIAYYSSSGANAQEGFEGWKKSPSHNPLLINDGMWSKIQWKAIGISLHREYGLVWFSDTADPDAVEACPN